MPIGEFSRLCGLSIGALRHYDQVGLLRPAGVDAATSYRRYAGDQLETARLIARLRDLELPLDHIQDIVRDPGPARRRATLTTYLAQVEARATRMHRIIHQLHHLIDPTDAEELVMSTSTSSSTDGLDADTQRSLASSLFNRVWELLERTDRGPDDDEEMLNAAHASRYLWTTIGTAKNWAIGDWQISRVYSVVGRGEPAVHHARRCLSLAQQVEGEVWLLASAYEALSRAYGVSGDRAAAAEWRAKAEAQLELVTDLDERDIVARDIATLPQSPG